jgi:hypothetical protein
VTYVRVFEHAGYDGASAYLSQSYDSLGDIGWNDRITSLRVVNGGSGSFYVHSGYSGGEYPFCCNQNVANVGPSWNDTFSSVSGSA